MLGIFFEFKDDATQEEREEIQAQIDEIVKFHDLLRIGDSIILGKDFLSSVCSIHKIIEDFKKIEFFQSRLKSSYVLNVADFCNMTPLIKKGCW